MIISRWSIATAVGVLAAMIAASLAAWSILPGDAAIPVHYDLSGNVDRYGSLAERLVGIPAIAAGLFLLILLLARQEPRRDHLKRSRQALDWSLTGAMLMLVALHCATLAAAAGWAVSVPALTVIGLGALFVLIGNFLPKTRSNFLIGIRTPWTLSSDYSWSRTHILAGRAFVGLGLAILVGALIAPQWSFVVMTAGAIAVVTLLIVASWLFWRADSGPHS